MKKLGIVAFALFFMFAEAEAASIQDGATSVKKAATSVTDGICKHAKNLQASIVEFGKQSTEKKVIAAFIVGGIIVYLVLKGPDLYEYFIQPNPTEPNPEVAR